MRKDSDSENRGRVAPPERSRNGPRGSVRGRARGSIVRPCTVAYTLPAEARARRYKVRAARRPSAAARARAIKHGASAWRAGSCSHEADHRRPRGRWQRGAIVVHHGEYRAHRGREQYQSGHAELIDGAGTGEMGGACRARSSRDVAHGPDGRGAHMAGNYIWRCLSTGRAGRRVGLG